MAKAPQPEDHAFSTLLETREEFSDEIPEEIVTRAYAIQKEHQFDRDLDHSLQVTLKLLEDHLKNIEKASQDASEHKS